MVKIANYSDETINRLRSGDMGKHSIALLLLLVTECDNRSMLGTGEDCNVYAGDNDDQR